MGHSRLSYVPLFDRMVAAWNERDLDEMLTCFADDTVFDGSEFAEGVYRGKDAYRTFVAGFWQVTDYQYSDAYRYGEVGDRAVAVIRGKGAGVGSGLPIDTSFIFSYVLRDGVVAEQKFHSDLDTVPDDLRAALDEQSPEAP
jgi:ketosteroid isomerase-like protein